MFGGLDSCRYGVYWLLQPTFKLYFCIWLPHYLTVIIYIRNVIEIHCLYLPLGFHFAESSDQILLLQLCLKRVHCDRSIQGSKGVQVGGIDLLAENLTACRNEVAQTYSPQIKIL